MRGDWEARQAEKETSEDDLVLFDEGEYSSDVEKYFNAGRSTPSKAPQIQENGDSDEISNEKTAS